MASLVLKSRINGHVLVRDKNTNKILLEKNNSIHVKNMSTAIARGLANKNNSKIFSLKLGNGGTVINNDGATVFRSPNTKTLNSNLYNTVHSEIVDENSTGAGAGNFVAYQDAEGPDTPNLFSVVIVTAEISVTEPTGQAQSDISDPNYQFAFDELGLFTEDGLMLSHAIFNPIVKSAESDWIIQYTLTVMIED